MKTNPVLKWIGILFSATIAIILLKGGFDKWMMSVESSSEFRVIHKEKPKAYVTKVTVTKFGWSVPYKVGPGNLLIRFDDRSVWLDITKDGGQTYLPIEGGTDEESIARRKQVIFNINPLNGQKLQFKIRGGNKSITELEIVELEKTQ